ncbi:MAG: DUF1616 domain-containing protein [Candidatus Thermoplasmatota archaeon]|nr:DUF1616 domain-containing protein [Candidatus Thermoplasmatota archaeon]
MFDKYPVDIILCMLCSAILIPIILLNINDTLKIFLGLLFLLFVPGYLLLFVLFPTKKTDEVIDFIERIALSFGISLGIVAITGIALYFIAGKIQTESALISIFIFEISIGIISLYRWFKTVPDERLVLSIDINSLKLKNNFKSKGKLDKVLIIILIILIIVTATIFIFEITTPRLGEKFTGFNILGPNRNTTNYPRNITVGENKTIIIGLTNHEYQTINYTIEVWLINKTITFNESTNENTISYDNAWFVDKINITLNHTDKNIDKEWEPQWEYNYTFKISKKGENLTLAFLLFKTSTDSYNYTKDYKDIIKQKIDYSYEELYLWITVH